MNHLEEWKTIRQRYENQEQTPQIEYRIKCITSLIKEAESKEKELNHFK